MKHKKNAIVACLQWEALLTGYRPPLGQAGIFCSLRSPDGSRLESDNFGLALGAPYPWIGDRFCFEIRLGESCVR